MYGKKNTHSTEKEVIIIQLPLIGTNIIVYSGNHYTFTFERVI